MYISFPSLTSWNFPIIWKETKNPLKYLEEASAEKLVRGEIFCHRPADIRVSVVAVCQSSLSLFIGFCIARSSSAVALFLAKCAHFYAYCQWSRQGCYLKAYNNNLGRWAKTKFQLF